MARYVRKANVEVAPMLEETILYDPSAKSFCVLNPTAAFLWEQLAQPRSEPELTTVLRERFAIPEASDVPSDVRASLERFTTLGLVVPAPDSH